MKSIAVLLTMWNTEQRSPMYARRISWWETHIKSPDSLFIVDSFGKGQLATLPSTHLFSFDQTTYIKKKASSSTFELLALQLAIDHWKNVLLHYEYVFKVTAKYVVPGLLNWVHASAPNSVLLIQNIGKANTEVLGIKGLFMERIIAKLTKLNHIRCCIENALQKISKNFSYTKMPAFYVPYSFRTKRGAGDILPHIR